MRFGRFLANPRVTVERLIEGWGEATAAAAGGRHVLAIQSLPPTRSGDTTELNFRTAAGHDRGLGELPACAGTKGVGRGLLVHAMLAVDARSGHALGLVAGRVWTRRGRVTSHHGRRRLSDKESGRWLTTAARAKAVLTAAATVTVVADRESDVYAVWAAVPEDTVHVLGRVYSDRSLAEGGDSLFSTLRRWPAADTADLEVRERPDRPPRTATVSLRFGTVTLRRPRSSLERDLPKTVSVIGAPRCGVRVRARGCRR